ncbi:MAG: PTS sugar transporter subunit IIA [Nitrososphaeria archaeon]
MEIKNFLFNEDLVFVKKIFENKDKLLIFLANALLEKGAVRDSFVESILTREKEHPTGLELGRINIAIPHTDTEHTKTSSMTVLTLKSPINFNRMDKPEVEIPVHIVFMLAIQDPNEYVNFLGKLASQFSNQTFIDQIYESDNSIEIYEKIKQILEV